MTDFVRDATTLPDGKTDARPLTGPASQHVTAAEWNTTLQAIYDTRTALRETFDVRNYGASTGAADNSAAFQAAITAAGGCAFRLRHARNRRDGHARSSHHQPVQRARRYRYRSLLRRGHQLICSG